MKVSKHIHLVIKLVSLENSVAFDLMEYLSIWCSFLEQQILHCIWFPQMGLDWLVASSLKYVHTYILKLGKRNTTRKSAFNNGTCRRLSVSSVNTDGFFYGTDLNISFRQNLTKKLHQKMTEHIDGKPHW